MKSIRVILLFGLFGLLSCGNDLEITNWNEATPIVYGIVSPLDSIQEISLKRSFLCEVNPLDYTSNPDSNYYNDAQVFLETRLQHGEIIQRVELLKYELPARETDMFVSSPNYVYRCIKKDLIRPIQRAEELKYALTITIPDQENSIFAEAIIPPLPEIFEPRPGAKPFKINLLSPRPFHFTWEPSLKFYIEFETIVNILEERDGEWVETSISHRRKYNHWDKTFLKNEMVEITGEWFYPMLAGKIDDDPAVTARKFRSIDFILKTSDASFYDYFAYENYLTDLSTNIFTNVVNGLGIFVAYNRQEWKGYTLNEGSLGQLVSGKHTKHLKFRRWD